MSNMGRIRDREANEYQQSNSMARHGHTGVSPIATRSQLRGRSLFLWSFWLVLALYSPHQACSFTQLPLPLPASSASSSSRASTRLRLASASSSSDSDSDINTPSSATTTSARNGRNTNNNNNNNDNSGKRMYSKQHQTASASHIPSQKTSQSPAETERLIVSLGRSGRTDQALQLYQSLDKPTIRQLNACIDACARARPVRLDQAFQLLQQTQTEKSSLIPNVYTFGALMSACARAGQVDAALKLLHQMTDTYGVTPNAVVYNAAISACARATTPQPNTAWKLLDRAVAARIPLTVVGYNAALSAAARAGDYQAALQLFDTMLDPSQKTAPAPDQVTYGTVLAACEKSQQWRRVLEYADQMQDAGYRLDGLAATSALKACQQLGLAASAVEYLQKMKESADQPVYERKTAGWQVAGRRRPLRGPDSVAYTLAISACARGGAWQQGIQLLEEYTSTIGTGGSVGTGGNVGTGTGGVNATGSTGRPQLQAAARMNDNNTVKAVTNSKNTDHAVMMYTAAMTGCEYAGEWKAAFALLERMRQAGVEPNEATFAAVIGACGTACANMMNSNHRSTNLNANLHSESKRDETTGAVTTTTMPLPLRKALQLLAVIKKDFTIANPSIQVYNAAIRACAEALDLPRALLLLDKVREEGLEPTVITYGSLVTACERVGSVDDLSKVFKLMKQDGLNPNEIIYGAAISCCRKAGEAERALLLFRKMLREELKPNVVTFNTVILAQTESKVFSPRDVDRAILVYKILKAQQYSPASPNRQTYTILIRFLTANKQPREADGLLRQMAHDGLTPDVDLYTATVTAYEQTKQPLQALRLMESMRADGYDFYEAPVLNEAFKRAVKLVNVVGRGLASDTKRDNSTFTIDAQDGQGEAFIGGEND